LVNAFSYAPVLAFLVVFELALDHVDHDFVADQTALVHDLLGLLAQRRLLCDLGSQHITGGLKISYPSENIFRKDTTYQMAHTVLFLDPRRLGSLACRKRM
jgi:hypothetical protein